MTTTHSPLPWTARPQRYTAQCWIVVDNNGAVIDSELTEDNARLIVTAVNHHAELVAALQAISREFNVSIVRSEVRLGPNTLAAQKAARAVLGKVPS